jgi:hypothetical protein
LYIVGKTRVSYESENWGAENFWSTSVTLFMTGNTRVGFQ